MLAAIEGTLTRTDTGCLALESPYVDGAVTATMFPYGSELSPDGESVKVPELGTVRIGDQVSGGAGGFVSAEVATAAGAPPECLGGDQLLLWQAVE